VRLLCRGWGGPDGAVAGWWWGSITLMLLLTKPHPPTHRHARRGGESSMDVSADLTELGRTPVAVVCAGAKSVSVPSISGLGVGAEPAHSCHPSPTPPTCLPNQHSPNTTNQPTRTHTPDTGHPAHTRVPGDTGGDCGGLRHQRAARLLHQTERCQGAFTHRHTHTVSCCDARRGVWIVFVCVYFSCVHAHTQITLQQQHTPVSSLSHTSPHHPPTGQQP